MPTDCLSPKNQSSPSQSTQSVCFSAAETNSMVASGSAGKSTNFGLSRLYWSFTSLWPSRPSEDWPHVYKWDSAIPLTLSVVTAIEWFVPAAINRTCSRFSYTGTLLHFSTIECLLSPPDDLTSSTPSSPNSENPQAYILPSLVKKRLWALPQAVCTISWFRISEIIVATWAILPWLTGFPSPSWP